MPSIVTGCEVLQAAPHKSVHERQKTQWASNASERDASAVLVVSPDQEDHINLRHILSRVTVNAVGTGTCKEALALLRWTAIPVVICEQKLPDGDWQSLSNALTSLAQQPPLIVMSRLADEHLWMEVLNLGGWDVLAKPFHEQEVLWVVESAWCRWDPAARRDRRLVVREAAVYSPYGPCFRRQLQR
jgi:DNA-binding NtrC family response regulator